MKRMFGGASLNCGHLTRTDKPDYRETKSAYI
jgi:hypothetical protein